MVTSVKGSVPTSADEDVVCTITNTRRTGTLTVVKVLSPAGDPGKFNLQIDGTTKAANVGDGGATGAVTGNTRSHSIGETSGTATNLADYAATTSCLARDVSVPVRGRSVTLGE